MQINVTEQNALRNCRNIINTYVRPLVYGDVLDETPQYDDNYMQEKVVFNTAHKIRIYAPEDVGVYFEIKRPVPFRLEEKDFVKDIMQKIYASGAYKSSTYHLQVCGCIEYAIASLLGGEKYAETVFQAMQVYNRWATETHEGKRIEHTVGIYLNRQREGTSNFFELSGYSALKTIGSTADTILTIGNDGSVIGVENISAKVNNYKKNQDILAPVTQADVAVWTTSQQRVAIRLTSAGEILIFKNRRLVFARRRSHWHCFPHKFILESILAGNMPQEEKEAKKAVYLTAIDMALANRGACVGVFTGTQEKQEGLSRVHSEVRFDSGNKSEPTLMLADIIDSRKFYEIPRRIRAELCAIDGALIIDASGNILTAGAILQTNGNVSGGGGRTAAAQALGQSGFGIKISADGYIEIYNGNNPPLCMA